MILGELEALEAGWDAAAAGSPLPTQQFAWVRACADTYGAHEHLRIVRVGSLEAPRALALLAGGWARRFDFAGSQLCEPVDLVYTDAEALRLLAEELAGRFTALSLSRLPQGSASIEALRAAYRRRGLVRLTPSIPAPFITLDECWREPESRFNARRRSDIRRARRHAAGLGAVSFEVRSPQPHEVPPLLDEAFRAEGAGWKSARGSALACDVRRGAFFRRYAALSAATGQLRLCFMRIGGAAVAMQLAVECGGAFSLLKIGYDERYAQCSPGTLLMLHTVAYAARQGLESYEFLGAPAPWTRVWTERERPCVSLRTYPFTPLGAAALAYDAARFGYRKIALSNLITASRRRASA